MELERMDGHGSFVEEEEDFLVLSFVLESFRIEKKILFSLQSFVYKYYWG